MGHAQFTLST